MNGRYERMWEMIWRSELGPKFLAFKFKNHGKSFSVRAVIGKFFTSHCLAPAFRSICVCSYLMIEISYATSGCSSIKRTINMAQTWNKLCWTSSRERDNLWLASLHFQDLAIACIHVRICIALSLALFGIPSLYNSPSKSLSMIRLCLSRAKCDWNLENIYSSANRKKNWGI